MSSLAAQLAKNVSLNAELLVDRSRRKPAESYLFTGHAADHHDLESIHALGVNGLLQLALLDPSLREFEDQLFSEYAKSTDRTLLSAEANAELDASISAMLTLLGPYVMEAPTGKVLEWLVKRFRINEFNFDAVLSLFLPYHETVHFTKMLSILHVKQNSAWSFLLPFKSAAQSLPRMSLVKEMIKNADFARFVTSLLPSALKENRSHRVLLAFNAACLHDFILQSQELDEGTVAYLLPALLEPLQHQPAIKDAILGSYILLAALSQKCRIVPTALGVVVSAMSGCIEHVQPRQYINALLSVCEPQEELEQFSKETIDTIIRVPNVERELQDACNWVGIEKILYPLITGFVDRLNDDDRISPLLESIVAIPKLPSLVLQRIALQLVRRVLASETSSQAIPARRLLGGIQQRYPSNFQKAMDIASQEVDGQDVVDQLRISLAVVQDIDPATNSTDNVDSVLASTNTDPRVRAVAVGRLLEQLSQIDSIAPTELKSIHSALLARAQDTDQGVVDALYSQPQMLLPVFSADVPTYITNLESLLFAPGAKPKRSLLRAHFKFLLIHWYPVNPSHQDSVFQRIIFPFLLFSKGRQHTAEAVWEIITSQGVNSFHKWLAGCTPIVTGPEGKDLSGGVAKMANLNTFIASQIARNIAQSEDYFTHIDTLTSRLSDANSHAKILGYLIVRALLAQLPRVDQIEVANRVVDEIMAGDPKELGRLEDQPQGVSLQYDAALAKAVVTKPSSRSTLQMLQLAIIAAVPSIPRPDDTVLNWMGEPSQMSDQGARYIQLNRKIYVLANVSGSTPHFTIKVLQSLFEGVGKDTLAFLAGIWIVPAESVEQSELQITALHHASAFLQACVLGDDGVDFQTILPSLLVALQSHNVNQRTVTMKCIYHLYQLTDRQFTSIYGFDTIYGMHGMNKNELQYLERDDLRRYIDDLVRHRDHLTHDPNYLRIFHQQHLNMDRVDKKRDSQYRRHLLCFLVSHINLIAFTAAQATLLKSIELTSNSAKATTLLPTINSLVLSAQNNPTKTSQEFIELVMACFDLSVATVLNDGQEPLWDVFISLIRIAYSSGSTQGSRSNLSRALEDGLFAALSFERKVALCELFLDLSANDTDTSLSCKQLLSSLLQDVPLITRILDSLLPAHSASSPRIAKRAKMIHTPENTLLHLSTFAEILGARSLPGSLDLVSHLLEALSRVVQSVSSSQADLSYIEQLLMSAVENAANEVTEIPNVSPSVVRLDVLVDVIRVADNPQTFHQALLLLANLANLVPESVLHHAMPIFTFMGSNIFHRDDAYSFKVMQRTIDSIVPVMASSLKSLHSQPLDLYIAAKSFLRVFTDAANHIPRHRRTNFFVHLVDVLGPGEFLSPVCMLFVEKVSNRALKRSTEEIQNSFALPVSVLQHCEPSLQINTLANILQESKRLVDRQFNPNATALTFLEVSTDEEPSPAFPVNFRRRAQALVLFVECALKPSTFGSTSEGLKELVSTLIALSTPLDGTSSYEKTDDICQTAQACLNKALSVMSASDFINGILSMLESGDKQIQVGALDLLRDRLVQVSSKARVAVAAAVVKIITVIKNLLLSKIDESLALASFGALRSISLTLCPGELTPITEVIPSIISYIQRRIATATAISTLSCLPARIGPRIIPHFREIVSQCVAIIREDPSSVTTGAIDVLHSLLSSIPAFWGVEEITQVVILYVDTYASASKPSSSTMLNLMKTMTKRGPANALLPALFELWPTLTVDPQKERLLPYFDILSRSLRGAARSDVLEHLRPVFKVFLESLELSKDPGLEVEAKVIAAFQSLVVNLNEASFRPLFRRLYDWAFANDSPNEVSTDDDARKTSFCRVYISLLDFFKGLMTPYMSFMVAPFVEILQTFGSGIRHDQLLWAGVIETLTKSLSYDDGVFWRDDRLRQITPPLVQQLSICVSFNTQEVKISLQDCLLALVDSVADDMLLKSINLDILMHTRAEDVRLRLFALSCSERLWVEHGGKLLGFATEVATFIAECTEDENDMVVRESFKLKDAVESVAGNINGL